MCPGYLTRCQAPFALPWRQRIQLPDLRLVRSTSSAMLSTTRAGRRVCGFGGVSVGKLDAQLERPIRCRQTATTATPPRDPRVARLAGT
eukprot:scaffold20098_cov104-Isochrysis_galbana.AAC.3